MKKRAGVKRLEAWFSERPDGTRLLRNTERHAIEDVHEFGGRVGHFTETNSDTGRVLKAARKWARLMNDGGDGTLDGLQEAEDVLLAALKKHRGKK